MFIKQVHVKSWLLCSMSCLLSSKYNKAVQSEDRPKFEALFREEKVCLFFFLKQFLFLFAEKVA